MRSPAKSVEEILHAEAFKKIMEVADEYRAVNEFGQIFPDLERVVQAVKVKKGVLFLRAENSVWRSELNFRQELLVKRINKYLNKEIIKSIKFIV